MTDKSIRHPPDGEGPPSRGRPFGLFPRGRARMGAQREIVVLTPAARIHEQWPTRSTDGQASPLRATRLDIFKRTA
jgi:hypothetical protein